MIRTRGEIIQALVMLRNRQHWCIRMADGTECRDERAACDVIANGLSGRIARLERLLRENPASEFEDGASW